MKTLKLRSWLCFMTLCSILICSCQESETEPVHYQDIESSHLIEANLNFLANQLRSNGKTLNDSEFVLDISKEFITTNFSENDRVQALEVFNSINHGAEGNLENADFMPPEVADLVNQINDLNTESESLEDYLSGLESLKDEFIGMDLTDEIKFEGLTNIQINSALAIFYFENGDLFVSQSGSIANHAEGTEGWWSRAKAYLKCAAGVVGGALTGAVAGCGVGTKVGAAFGPQAALSGCGIGVIVGGIGGGLTGAVASGCFEL